MEQPPNHARVPTSTIGDESDEDDFLEIPSCIESLVSSSEQLQQLACQASQYYIKSILCYCQTTGLDPIEHQDNLVGGQESRITAESVSTNRVLATKNINTICNDQNILQSMREILELLPLLKELVSFTERCFLTIEATLKRSIYHLIKSQKNTSILVTNQRSSDEFTLTSNSKLDVVFVSLMDLIYTLVSLDKTIVYHTDICQNLSTFVTVCKLLLDANDSQQEQQQQFASSTATTSAIMLNIPRNKLEKLTDFVSDINFTLGRNNCSSLFNQCLEHFEHFYLHLVANEGKQGFRILQEKFEAFIQFYGESLIEFNRLSTIPIISSRFSTKSGANQSLYYINVNITPSSYLNTPALKLFGLTSLYIFYSTLFKQIDNKRLIKLINQLIIRIKPNNCLPLHGSNCFLLLEEFLITHMPKNQLDFKIIDLLRAEMTNYLKLDTKREFERHYMELLPWLSKLKSESFELISGTSTEWPRKQIYLLDHGLKLISELNSTIRNLLAVYLHSNVPMTKSNLIYTFKLITLVKAIEQQIISSDSFVGRCCINVAQMVRKSWRKLIVSIQKRLQSLKYSERKLPVQSIIVLSSICSKAETLSSSHGRKLLAVAMSMLVPLMNNDEISSLNQLLDLIRNDYMELYLKFSNCNYIYWSMSTFSVYYNHVFEEHLGSIEELNYFHLALDDMVSLFNSTNRPNWSNLNLDWLTIRRSKFLIRLNNELMEQFKNDFLDKICQEFEMELRLQTHRDLYIDGLNPFRRRLYNFKQIFKAQRYASNFRILNQSLNGCYYIENHINKICYNLTSIAPHDWFAYDRMINLAQRRYHLQLANTQLPAQTFDSGLDLLDILRNLSLFASRYGYDLTNQLFIEKVSSNNNRLSTGSMLSSYAGLSSNQTLNVVQVRHVVSSIQTHGYGVLDSAVNCSYQTLKRLINVFSKQLSDNKLRNSLQKATQQLVSSSSSSRFHSNQAGTMVLMNFERATQLARKFRFSAMNPNDTPMGASRNKSIGMDMDCLRQTVTQLGNVLAFIRLLKSGALNCASKSVDYLPDLNSLSLVRFSKYLDNSKQEDGMQKNCSVDRLQSVRFAVKNLDQCLADFDENLSPKTDYLKIIVGLFCDLLSNKTSAGHIGSYCVDSGRSKSVLSDSDTNLKNLANNNEPDHVYETADTDNDDDDDDEFDDIPEEQDDLGRARLQAASGATKFDHLNLFFLLVPTLTINYIDYIINCKERVVSRSSSGRLGAIISDDGFPIGVAFLLTVLGQVNEFGKLEWARQVQQKLDVDRNEVKRRLSDSRDDESLRQTSSITLRRLDRLSSEYLALDCTLASALLLFKGTMLPD